VVRIIILVDLHDLELTLNQTFRTLHHMLRLTSTHPRASHLTMEGEEDGMGNTHILIKGIATITLIYLVISSHLQISYARLLAKSDCVSPKLLIS